MNEAIKNLIFEQTFNTYNHNCFSKADLQSVIEELNKEIELALDCYYRFDDEERDVEIIERAWDMYITVREYNNSVINALKTIIRERGDK